MYSKHNPIKNGNLAKDEIVYPIKKQSSRNKLKRYWLNNSTSRTGRRNWTLFRVGIVTGLRASDLVKLEWNQLYDQDNEPRNYIYAFREQKTKKMNHHLNIKPIKDDLIVYRDYCFKNKKYSIYMFPSDKNKRKHITAHTVYDLMAKAGDDLGWEHIGSHSIRKTFGYIAYSQTHNLGYVMKRLNHHNPSTTLRYIGVEKETMDKITESIDWS